MATLLMIVLIVGYAWSVWSLKRQEHFDERPRSEWRRRTVHFVPMRPNQVRRGEAS